MKKILILLLLFASLKSFAQTDPHQTPNALTTNPPDTASCSYGINSGYLAGGNWPDTSSARLQYLLGAHSTRTSNPEAYQEEIYGNTWALTRYQFNQNKLDFYNNTVFLNGMASDHTDTTIYNYPAVASGTTLYRSVLPKGLYTPIWNSDGTVDTANNYWARYVYHMVVKYPGQFRYYEVWNEPDLGGGQGLYLPASDPKSYWQQPGEPQNYYNMYGHIFAYIRMLRITYEIVHVYAPQSKVVTGGIGYAQTMDMILRYTDNPGSDGQGNPSKGAGTVTSAYPYYGGAWFDMCSLHDYPNYSTHKYSNAIAGQVYLRNSDTLIKIFHDHLFGHNGIDSVVKAHGFNGATYPKKQYMFTEFDTQSVSDWNGPQNYGSDEMQLAYTIKQYLSAQKDGIVQLYKYSFADEGFLPPTAKNYTDNSNTYMGSYSCPDSIKNSNYSLVHKKPAGIAETTISGLFFNYAYDSVATKNLNTDGVNFIGIAFTNSKVTPHITRYAIWTEQHNDKSESTTKYFTFPNSIKISKAWTWNASKPGATDYLTDWTKYPSQTVYGQTVILNGLPKFFQ